MFWIQLRNELLKLLMRKRTHIGFGAFVIVQLLILGMLHLPVVHRAFSHVLQVNGYLADHYYYGLTFAVLIVVFSYSLLGPLYIALVSGDMISKEVEDGTLRMILSRPISRLRLLTIKWLACSIYTFALMIFLGLTSLAAGLIFRHELGGLFVFVPQEQVFAVFEPAEGLWRFARSLVVIGLVAQIVAAVAFMFSCFNMKPSSATILTLSVMFVDYVLRSIPYFSGIQKYFISYHVACWSRTFLEIVPWWSVAESLVYLTALGGTFWIIGAMAFCSRDFKS